MRDLRKAIEHTPGFIGWLEMTGQPLLEFRSLALNPSPLRCCADETEGWPSPARSSWPAPSLAPEERSGPRRSPGERIPLAAEGQETREYLSAVLKGWWKLRHPIIALRLYRSRRTASESNRRAANRSLLEGRRTDPALASLNDEQRRAVLIQEDCTLIVGRRRDREDAHDG